jgi:hypothetical protein
MSVEVTQHPQLRTVMDLFVKLVEHERRFVVLGVRASNGPVAGALVHII